MSNSTSTRQNGQKVYEKLSRSFETIRIIINEHSKETLNASNLEILGAYVSTELYMLTDKSEGLRDTWFFLEDRVKTIKNFDNNIIHVNSFLPFSFEAPKALF